MRASIIRQKSARRLIRDEIEVASRDDAYALMLSDTKIISIHIYAPLGETEYEYTRAERDKYGNQITGNRDENGFTCIGWSNCD